MTFDRWADSTQPGSFESDLQKARGYKPITRKEITKAYSEYKDVGLKFGQVKKNQTDEALFEKAKETVLAWWKKQKSEGPGPKGGPGMGGNPGPVPGSGGTGGGGGGSAGGGSTGSGTGQGSNVGGVVADTAMGVGMPPGYVPPPPFEDATARLVAHQRILDSGKGRNLTALETKDQPAPPLTAAQSSAILKQMGVPSTWNPPAYALKSEADLKGWVQRAQAQAQIHQASGGNAAVLNDQYVQATLNNLGISGISPASVPSNYRVSISVLTTYLLGRAAAQKLEAANAARLTKAGIF